MGRLEMIDREKINFKNINMKSQRKGQVIETQSER
jgi:hypothetical protein